MADSGRPAGYLAYVEVASGILGRAAGDDALRSYGFSDIQELSDLSAAFAFLEAQGRRCRRTKALSLVGLVGLADVPSLGEAARTTSVLGVRFGASPGLLAVAGYDGLDSVLVDRLGIGLVHLAHDAPLGRDPGSAEADDYVSLFPEQGDEQVGALTVVVPETEFHRHREAIVTRTQLGAAAEMLGVVGRVLDDAVEHALRREQFGKTLASHQAIQHLLAWAATERYQLECLFDIAVDRAERGHVDIQLCKAVKAVAGRSVHAVVQIATQVTGAMAFTWEHPLTALHRRGLVLDQMARPGSDLARELGRETRDGNVPVELFAIGDARP